MLLINLCLCPASVPSPDPCTFYQRNNCTYQVMCNFWKHQGFCPRGNSCTYAHGEADKRPQYSGDDVRRKIARPVHYEHTQQPAAEAVATAAASDPAELMRQVAAASGRAAAGASFCWAGCLCAMMIDMMKLHAMISLHVSHQRIHSLGAQLCHTLFILLTMHDTLI